MKLSKAMASLGGLTFISRLTGFVRDQMAASFLGSGSLMDAFVVAFRLPNLFRALFAEGAFHSVFVPLFARKLEEGGKEKANQLSGRILSIFALFLLVLVVIVELFMPQVIQVIAGGQAIDKDLTIYLARIMFPYMMMVALASAGAAMMNSLSRFVAAAMLPIILNLGMVFTLIIFYRSFATAAHAYAFGVIFSGIIQMIWISYFCIKNKVFPKPTLPKPTPESRIFFARLFPGILAAGVYQINAVLGTRLASAIEGGNSWLYYADRLYQLPLGVIGVAASTALLPMISRSLEAGDEAQAISSQNKALEITLILAFPCMVGLIILAPPIINILFERGQFDASDTLMVAKAVAAYSLGLPAAMIIRILSAGFFGRGDTKTPFFSAVFAVSIFIALNFIFIHFLGHSHIYIAFASSASIWGQALLLWLLLKQKRLWNADSFLLKSIGKSLLLALFMGGLLWLLKHWIIISDARFILRFTSLIATVILGSIFWFGGAYFLGLIQRIRS
ncbi:MAG: murein biosynthesis integral membrane protein MurJ [Alphaproteobacteria bacterium]